MKTSILPSVALLMMLVMAPSAVAETGKLKIRFQYGGDPTDPVEVNVTKDKEFCGKTKLYDEQLIVNKENKGIKNIILYVYMRGTTFDVAPANKTHTMANDKCRFEPHVVIAQSGDKLDVTNPDEVSHNANLHFLENAAQNFTIPPGQNKVVDLEKAEPTAIPVECNIHPWMKGYVMVLDHPYVGLSNDNGELTIENLPTGELTFRIWCEGGSFKGASVNGEEVSRRGTFDVDVKAGENDLGTVTMPAQ